MRKMLIITLSFIVLLITSCDSGSDNNCPFEGTWNLSTFNYFYSDECTNGGEDGSIDLQCLTAIVANDTVTWDTCDCEGADQDDCTEEAEFNYTCETTFSEDNAEVIIDGNTATYTLIEPVEEFLLYDGGSYGDGCMITSMLVFERD